VGVIARLRTLYRVRPLLADALIASVMLGSAALLITSVGPPKERDLIGSQWWMYVAAWAFIATRRTNPLAVLCASASTAAITALVGPRPGPLVLAGIVDLLTFCLASNRRRSIIIGGIVAVIFYGSALASTDEIPSSAPVIILPLWCAGVVALADAVRSRRALIAATNERIRVAEETRERQTRQRVVEERLTIARDLHDLVGHHLSVMMVHTGVAAHVLRSDPDRAESALGLARDSGRSVMDELRDLLGVLRDGDGEPTERVPTIDDIHALVDATRA
jgi:signal transduction histidine kinase